MITKLTIHLTQTTIQKVGTLAQKDNKIYFEYDKEFLKRGIELSPYKLPLKQGVQVCKDDVFDGLWGVFADSLPDGWGRLLMDRHLIRLGLNPNALTPLDGLSYVGAFGMGALGYEPIREIGELFESEIVLDKLSKSAKEILEGSSDDLVDELLKLGGSSAGARPKVLVQINRETDEMIHGRQRLKAGFQHYIVKFASSSDPKEIGAIEYAYALMAKAAGIDMSECHLIEGKRGRYFASERFDRIGDERVHMHSVAGLVHADFRFPTLDYEDLMTLTWHLTKNHSDVQKMFRLAAFNLFAHNRDDHAKNFSFLMDRHGNWRLSPAYDLTLSFGPGGEHSTTYLTEGKAPTKEHLDALAKKFSIKNADKIIDEVLYAINRWEEFAKDAGIGKKHIKEIKNYFVR